MSKTDTNKKSGPSSYINHKIKKAKKPAATENEKSNVAATASTSFAKIGNEKPFLIQAVKCHDTGTVFHKKISQSQLIYLELYLHNKKSQVLISEPCFIRKLLKNPQNFSVDKPVKRFKGTSKRKFENTDTEANEENLEGITEGLSKLTLKTEKVLQPKVFYSRVINSPEARESKSFDDSSLIVDGNLNSRITKSPMRNQKRILSNGELSHEENDRLYGECSQKIGKEGKSRKKDTDKKKKHKKKDQRKNNDNLENEEIYNNYLSEDEVKFGLENGNLVKGFIRINPKNMYNAYVSNDNSTQGDYLINSIKDRNRALDGDEVALRIKSEEEWADGWKTAEVVFILKKVHPRTAVGLLKKAPDDDDSVAYFRPRDKRFPVMIIPSSFWPTNYKPHLSVAAENLFVCSIVTWDKHKFPVGCTVKDLGVGGNLDVETEAILRECSLSVTPFPEEYVKYMNLSSEIPAKEFSYREDFRDQCIFTIDPSTARDLDDALSCRELPNGNYEIGVHISDASFYLYEDTPLDVQVGVNATTIYLVNQTYHMLPIELCLLCSLLPGKDKLAFSVIWEMTKSAEVVSCRFTRSIINSCAQLAYEHAQTMIENPDRTFQHEELPKIHNSYAAQDLSKTINILNSLAVKMRNKRFENGALKIDQIKISFILDPVTGEPLEYRKQETKDANKLIEEFMLLANMCVSSKIKDCFPDLAFLRCHEPPKENMLMDLQRLLETFGMFIDVSSSAGIRSSLDKYTSPDFPGQCRRIVLDHLFTKPMVRARYFCNGDPFEQHGTHHYALSVDIYTHFTSPIRRYADIMVHRLLAASLEYREKPTWGPGHVAKIAENCNTKKYCAKKAGEMSTELFFFRYVEKHQPLFVDAVIVDVRENSCEALILDSGVIIRMFNENYGKNVDIIKESSLVRNDENISLSDDANDKKIWRHHVKFPRNKKYEPCIIVVELFCVIKLCVKKDKRRNKLFAELVRPANKKIKQKNDRL